VPDCDPDLGARATPVKGLFVRLVRIDPVANVDDYCVFQGLEDPSLDGDSRFYSFRRWGRTGTRGEVKIDGPSKRDKVDSMLSKFFKEKTGNARGTLKPGDGVKPGKYWVQQQATVDLKAVWEYHVSDGVDGKKTGWYPYLKDASEEVEDVFAQHEANKRESRTQTRVVVSGSGRFSYKVDLDAMTQINTSTNKVRQIRRRLGPKCLSGSRLLKSTKAKIAMKVAMKAMKTTGASKVSKVVTAMKVVHVMKAMKVMKVIRRPLKKVPERIPVFKGDRVKTRSGLKKEDLVKNKRGKVVSKLKSDAGKAHKWIKAVQQARNEKGYKGVKLFKRGTSFHDRATEIYVKSK